MRTIREVSYLTLQLAKVVAFVAGVYGVTFVAFVIG
jgi:hypothetical protein